MIRRSIETACRLFVVVSSTVWLASAERIPWPGPGPGAVSGIWTIDLATAEPAELRLLPGIGPVRSRAIMELRATRPGLRVEDLSLIPGIGPVTIERLVGSGLLRTAGRDGAER